LKYTFKEDFQSEDTQCDINKELIYLKLSQCLESMKNNTSLSLPVRYHYMRRRVCYKLFIVFEILMRNMNVDHEILKNLAICLELKARNDDPDMGDGYKNCISSIFNKIKESLIIGSISNINEIQLDQ